MRNSAIVVTGLLAALYPLLSDAQAEPLPKAKQAAADELFAQGRILMRVGHIASACEKFAGSLNLDPGLGTLLNLARCNEQLGKLTSAWKMYREAIGLAKQLRQRSRERFARSRSRALEPRLPRLVIQAPKIKIPGLAVTKNGLPFDPAKLASPIPVDPGEHEIVATAPGRRPFSTSVEAVEATITNIQLPTLDRVSVTKVEQQPRKHRASDRPTKREVAMIGIGFGAAMTTIGLGLGWSAIARKNDLIDVVESYTCAQDCLAQIDEVERRADLSNALVGMGLGLTTVGVLLYIISRSDRDDRALSIAPVLGPRGRGITVLKRF